MDAKSRWPNFSNTEMHCRCGYCQSGMSAMDPDFLDRLQFLRTVYGKPMVVSSGHRCARHPAELGKSKTGEHTLGLAVDVRCHGADALRLLQLALELGFNRIGVSQKGNSRFLHLGVSPIGGPLPSPALWSY
jgi:uncharacterized protein YcbK (DUF882 family)